MTPIASSSDSSGARAASTFTIGSHTIGAGRAFLVAEIAQAHDGSLGLAHAYVDAAANAGADAVKFQTHIASAESTRDEEFRVKFSLQDATRYDYWRRMEFTPEQWAGLAQHARERDLVFLSSAFSIEAIGLLAGVGMPAWKVASGEIGSDSLIAAMLATGAPFIVSTGMSPWVEIDGLAAGIRATGRPFAVLQCTSRYPTPLSGVGLNVIDEIRARYRAPAGLSDHSGSTHAALAALARGADVIEVHITLDRAMFGADVSSSLTVPEFRAIREFRDALLQMNASPVDKDLVAAELAPMRTLFGRSLAPRSAVDAGTILREDMLTTKKPGTGIPERELPQFVGRRLARAIVPDRLLRRDDIE